MSSEKKVAIMQPYFLPYLGYWQLINNVDTFVVYDEIEYTKKGWINRNRYLNNCSPKTFSVPLQKASDSCYIVERKVAAAAQKDLTKTRRAMESSYRKAPFFKEGMILFDKCLSHLEADNLFQFILSSINEVNTLLEIDTDVLVSSELPVSPALRSQERVITTCESLGATHYINPIGGIELYDSDTFSESGIELCFQKVQPYRYSQGCAEFVPHLSIIDVVMFNGMEGTKELLDKMDLVKTPSAKCQ
ncbi:hypothetical protein PSI9734_01620 [Pseudidiomarina piscicola]|uniref:WbqC-like protein family protein n=1 Tax=Pseudidiomarina piscicola TaxID=2614830 RepID=A0A6S6WQE3_9GAMM|nr:WbqC family protein [Pseudidiomarina piscicola]CAB0151207.1 hypothetical protein PSI9734_01620 [Pseudidiomarina piscicola]VZT40713.1 hypothetical protein PSI9734_01620 [Pseudomonas aeruginosa]